MGKKRLTTDRRTFEHDMRHLGRISAAGTAATMAGLGLCLAGMLGSTSTTAGISTLPVMSAAQETATGTVPIVAPTVVQNVEGNVVWGIDANGVLTIAPEDGIAGTLDVGTSASPWLTKFKSITAVKVVGKVTVLDAYNQNNGLFSTLRNCVAMDLSGLDTSRMESLSFMFNDCTSLKTLDLSHFDTSSCENMYYMFSGCSSLETLDLSNFDTSNVENMHFMFSNCTSLKSVNLSSFDTSKVRNMSCIFNRCSSLESLDLSSFDMTNTLNSPSAFSGCDSLKRLVLGTKTHFDEYPSYVDGTGTYTGSWIRDDAKYGPFTPAEMKSGYKGQDMAGTWVAEPVERDYRVSFDANGGQGSMSSAMWKLGTPEGLPASSFTWGRREFVGWNTRADGNGTAYQAGQVPAADLASHIGDAVTLYAQWKDVTPKPFDATLSVNAVIDGNVPADGTISLSVLPSDSNGNVNGSAVASGKSDGRGLVVMSPIRISDEGTRYYAIVPDGGNGIHAENAGTVVVRITTVMSDDGTLDAHVEYSADGGQSWTDDALTIRFLPDSNAADSEGADGASSTHGPQGNAADAASEARDSNISLSEAADTVSDGHQANERKIREQYDRYVSQTGDGMTLGIVPIVTAGITGIVAVLSRHMRRRKW